MKTTPHAKRRNNCIVLIVTLIVGTIAYGCMKKDDLNTQEKGSAILKMKDSVFKMQGWTNNPKDTTCDLKY